MKQWETEREEFLSICGQQDYDLLTEKEKMTQADYQRITHITLSLGFVLYTQQLISRHQDFALCEAEQFEREMEILADYPDYYADEEIYEKEKKWIEDFLNRMPSQKRKYYRQLVSQDGDEI